MKRNGQRSKEEAKEMLGKSNRRRARLVVGKIRATVYVRATIGEDHGGVPNAAEEQRDACLRVILTHAGDAAPWITDKDLYFADIGYGGVDFGRPGLRRLMEAVSEGRVDVVVVTRHERLARGATDSATLFDLFRANGVQLHTARN